MQYESLIATYTARALATYVSKDSGVSSAIPQLALGFHTFSSTRRPLDTTITLSRDDVRTISRAARISRVGGLEDRVDAEISSEPVLGCGGRRRCQSDSRES